MQTAQSIGLPDTEAQRLLAIPNFALDKATENLMVAYVGMEGAAPVPRARRNPAADIIHFTPCLTSDGARRGAEALFIHAVRPVMPQPQNDGSLQGGNLEVFESLLNDPVVLSPPRAERPLCDDTSSRPTACGRKIRWKRRAPSLLWRRSG